MMMNTGMAPKKSGMWLGVNSVSRTTVWCHVASCSAKNSAQ